MWRSILLSLCSFILWETNGQSLEIMPGTERLFADVQWFKPIGEDPSWTVFSRTRATVTDGNANLFSAAYLNWTSKSGLGTTLLGSISNNGNGMDLGVHFFRASAKTTIFAIISFGLKDELEYRWFSIVRFRPPIGEKVKLYTSLELFSSFNRGNHLISVQRLRLGLDLYRFQFGLALNLSELGGDFILDDNPGIFVRKEF